MSDAERPRLRRFDGGRFRWQGVEDRVYKHQDASETGLGWRDVVRNTLFGREGEPGAFDVRYFEIGPGGHSTLEKHGHVHAVTVVRGRGRIIAGTRVYDARPYDFVYIPAWTPHQFLGDTSEPLGFLCVVDRERDRPQPLSAGELAALRRTPEVARAMRL